MKKWNISCGCSGRTFYCSDGAKIETRQYCKKHEAIWNLKHIGRHVAIDKDGKEYDPTNNA